MFEIVSRMNLISVVTDNAANMKHETEKNPYECSIEELTEDIDDDSADDVSLIDDSQLNSMDKGIIITFWWLDRVCSSSTTTCSSWWLQRAFQFSKIPAAFKKAKAICILFHQSSNFRYAFNVRIPVPNETWWNSHLRLHEYILAYIDAINSALESCNHSTLIITTTDEDNLTSVVNVMKYFADILQSDKQPTSNCVIPGVDAIRSIKRESAATNALCEALQNSFEICFFYLIDSAIH